MGVLDTKKRGLLVLASLRYIKCHRPRCLVMENVKGLVDMHGILFKKILRTLTELSYNVYWRALNTREHGIQHNRNRVYVVGVRCDSEKRPFVWPTPIPFKYKLDDIIVRTPHDNPHALPSTDTPRQRNLVKHAYRKAIANGVNPAKTLVVVDIGSSLKFQQHATGYTPCMTATRAGTLDY